jgi:S-DNA-T family DNA segregation ATPase FtsK/SpoIIIE
MLPPEPDTAELIVRATHVEAPPIGEREEEEELPEQSVDADPDEPDPDAVDTVIASPSPDPDSLTPRGRYRASITDDPAFQWRVPTTRFLTRATGEAAKPDTAGQEQVAKTLLETLGHFGIEAKVIGRVTGPHITRYEIRLAPGTKVAKIAQLKDDLAYALAATDIRILAPIPGKQAVGVEVPNSRRRIVHLGDVFQDPPPEWSPLTVWLGKDIAGRAIGADLAKMPHLLVAGTTGSGKSACVNAMLSSILLRATPHEVRLVLVDPKQVELNHYESIPHLLTPVITSPRMAANALQNLVKEMEQRYGTMSLARTRSLPELNRAREKRGEPPLPYVLCVIDELADLMMVAPADVEDSIIRLAQKARAVGIHLVLATQSPRVDVITGMIKANVPSRIAFAVSSQTDSRVILDHNGAESLLGQGDMLFSPVGTSKLQRIQGAYIDEEQIAELTDAWRRQGEPEFHEELLEEVVSEDGDGADEGAAHADEDPLLEEAIGLVAQMGTASTSMLQRRLRLGYTRAGRLIDMLERRGIISGYEGSKPRQVLITEADVPRILSHLAEADGAAVPASAGHEPTADL